MLARVDCPAVTLRARWAIKTAIDPIHERFHQHPAFRRLLDDNLSAAEYGQVLRCFQAFHLSSEDIQAEADRAMGADESARRRASADAIVADLRSLGETGQSIVTPLPARTAAGWNIGYAYVVRGSALGGKLMYKALENGPMRNARAFLGGHSHDRHRWQAFCTAMDDHAVRSGIDDMTDGATFAFGHFDHCLEQAGL
jgi:heme oxygenase